MAYELDTMFTFGKYKGLSIKQVYQGSGNLEIKIWPLFVKIRIDFALDYNLNNVLKYEIDNSFVTLYYQDNLVSVEDWSKNLKFALADSLEKDRGTMKLIDRPNFIDFYVNHYVNNNLKLIQIPVGDPYYIFWCINNVSKFFLSWNTLQELEALEVYKYSGVGITKIAEITYECTPNITIGKTEIPEIIKEKSIEKLNDFLEMQNWFSNRNDDYWPSETSDSYYCVKCHESPCMCSDPDPE